MNHWHGIPGEAFIWTETESIKGTPKMRRVEDVLLDFGLNEASKWNWKAESAAWGVSDDGMTIVGTALNTQRPYYDGLYEAWVAKLGQILYINWDDAISEAQLVGRDLATGREYIYGRQGQSHEALNLPQYLPDGTPITAWIDEVVDGVKRTFQHSGLDIAVLDSRVDKKPRAALEVRFGPALWADEDGDGEREPTFGMSLDVAPKGASPIDRFNKRWDGEVAVFANVSGSDYDAPLKVAEVIVHESAHAMGLRHIDPDPNSAREVMDWDYYMRPYPAFWDQVTDIVTFPEGRPTGETHNPMYHLKRYAVADPTAGLKPGTWDVGAYTILGGRIQTGSPTLYDVVIFADEAGGYGEPGWFNLAYADELGPGVWLQFFANEGADLRIMGASTPGGAWDIFFGTGDAANPDLLFADVTGGMLSGSLFQYDPRTGAFGDVGSFYAEMDIDVVLTGAVPLPAAMWLAGSALAGLAAFRRRRSS
jgi:hypothetical protein